MKLKHIEIGQALLNELSRLVDKQPHTGHKGRHAGRERRQLFDIHAARTFWPHHKTQGIHAQRHGEANILTTRKTTELDSSAGLRRSTHGDASCFGVAAGLHNERLRR